MSTQDLENLLDGKSGTPAPALGDKTPEQIKAEEALKQEEQLANLKKAIAQANDDLKKVRDAKKAEGIVPKEEELPVIDVNDPNSKAWLKKISEGLDPVRTELDKEKQEVRTFALQEFLADKPLLAKNPDAVKKLMETYEKLHTASERTREGVLIDLRKAYAAENAEEILSANINERVDEARGAAVFSDIAVSRGSTFIPKEREKTPHLNDTDKAILAKWGMTPEQWVKQKQEQDKKGN